MTEIAGELLSEISDGSRGARAAVSRQTCKIRLTIGGSKILVSFGRWPAGFTTWMATTRTDVSTGVKLHRITGENCTLGISFRRPVP